MATLKKPKTKLFCNISLQDEVMHPKPDPPKEKQEEHSRSRNGNNALSPSLSPVLSPISVTSVSSPMTPTSKAFVENIVKESMDQFKLLPEQKNQRLSVQMPKFIFQRSLDAKSKKLSNGPLNFPSLTQSASINITDGFFKDSVMKQIEKKNNLDLNKLIIKKQNIGRGTAAFVHLAEYNHQIIALKEYKFNKSQFNNAHLASFQNELNILKVINNRFITKLFGFHLNIRRKCLKFAFEYAPKGNLFELIHPICCEKDKESEYEYEYSTALKILIDIAKAMKYLNLKKIIHRDLKPKNVLLFENNHVKVTDFGDAVAVDYDVCDFENFAMFSSAGTNGYKAPEMIHIDEENGYNYKVDMFSFGCIVYEILTKNFVSGLRDLTNWRSLRLRKHFVFIPDWAPNNLKNVIKKCWQFDPKKRPEFDAILQALEGLLMEHSLKYKK